MDDSESRDNTPISNKLSTGILNWIKKHYKNTNGLNKALVENRFIESKKFQNSQPGYIFTTKNNKTGYYRDFTYLPRWEFKFYTENPTVSSRPPGFDAYSYNEKLDGKYGAGWYKKNN